ncbi:hypothetical protein BRARA_I01330 [Brassica rapa]|uniref:Uncharacterized protein n=2 Tax=Brassica TaxID=3705 RepID=A0A397XYL8_BRACM|nr:hypothetical protein BRARA_I01330 [Brassica rapa]CAF2039478.1 unnamed protein product [Brassica napus]CDY47854.1 BnaA09g12330D [Brassica napus]
MKKTTQVFLLLFRLMLLICLVFQVRVTEARFRHLGEERIGAIPSIPCGAAPRRSELTGIMNRLCRRTRISRPPGVN